MPSNISSNDGLWSSATRDLSLRKQRKSRGAPMKERLSNFNSDSEDAAQVPKQEETLTKKAATSQLSQNLALQEFNSNGSGGAQTTPESPSTPSTPPVAFPAGKQRSTIFSRVRKVPFNKAGPLDVFHFEGEGLQFRGKLIGFKNVDAARGDEMCQQAMQELKNELIQKKEHKTRITIAVSLAGLKLKDDKGTTVMHHHAIPKISYIWRDQADVRSFGYVYGTPDSGHRFAAIKIADKSADTLVGAIHELFQVAFRLKQHEVDLAKKGQDDTSSNGSGDSKKENSTEVNDDRQHRKADEANLLDLESELFSLSQGIEQMNSMTTQNTDNQSAWAEFGGGDHISSASSTSSASDPWGRGSTPQSLRTITPDPFDTMVQYQSQTAPPLPLARPPVQIPSYATQQSAGSWGALPPAPPNSLFTPLTQSVSNGFPSNAFDSANPFGSFGGSSYSSTPGESNMFGMNNVTTSPAPDNAFSVFDTQPPVPQPVVQKEEKKVADPFAVSSELFGDILEFGAPRVGKTTKSNFPQPIKPRIGDLRGESTVITPARTTVDPFSITPSALGLSVSVSPPNQSSMMDFTQSSQSAQMMVPLGQRRVSTTVGAFGVGSVSPPIPPRPLTHSNSSGGFPSLAPPAPRRSTTQAPPSGAFGTMQAPMGGASSNPFGAMPAATQATQFSDPFADNFFS